MSSNVGLTTPRGTGTSGYVQRNLSALRPRDAGFGQPYAPTSSLAPKQRQPDKAILEHDRLRDIEVKVLELRDELEDVGELDDEQIDEKCEQLRKSLLEKGAARRGKAATGKSLKMHQVHELAEAKIRESERLRRALGIKHETKDGEEDLHPMARQERRKEKERERIEESEAGKVNI